MTTGGEGAWPARIGGIRQGTRHGHRLYSVNLQSQVLEIANWTMISRE